MFGISQQYPGFDLMPDAFTPLAGEREKQFQDWYGGYSKMTGLAPNPDDPLHKYNYRAWWSAMQNDPKTFAPQIDPGDGLLHSPSTFKHASHPTRYQPTDRAGISDSITGRTIFDPIRDLLARGSMGFRK